MKLHTLKGPVNRKPRKRVGRGDSSGSGRTAGRGDKGAGARAGYSRRPHFEGGQITFFRRLPKRGFKNPNHQKFTVVNVGALEQHFEAGAEVSCDALQRKGLIGKVEAGLKILGDGDLTKALVVKAERFSNVARQKIEAAGGSCETV